jgi:hypothetical protein
VAHKREAKAYTGILNKRNVRQHWQTGKALAAYRRSRIIYDIGWWHDTTCAWNWGMTIAVTFEFHHRAHLPVSSPACEDGHDPRLCASKGTSVCHANKLRHPKESANRRAMKLHLASRACITDNESLLASVRW